MTSRHYALIAELIEDGAYDPTTAAGMELINAELRSPFLPADAAELLAGWAINKRHEADLRNRKRQGGRWGVHALEVGDYVLTSGGETGRIDEIVAQDFAGSRFEVRCSGMNTDDGFSIYLRSFDTVELFPLDA